MCRLGLHSLRVMVYDHGMTKTVETKVEALRGRQMVTFDGQTFVRIARVVKRDRYVVCHLENGERYGLAFGRTVARKVR